MKHFAFVAVCIVWSLAIVKTSGATTNYEQAKREVHKGSTALTWLTNPAHHKYGTPRTRRRALLRAQTQLMHGLIRSGFWPAANCVHNKEAPWHYHGYFDGGMQMDTEFQGDYGRVYLNRWGDAGNWPVWAQLHASFKGWLSRGWYPWPNTARACGLL